MATFFFQTKQRKPVWARNIKRRVHSSIIGHKNVESGLLADIRAMGGRKQGLIQGRKNVESGLLARIRTPETQAKGGRISGRVTGPIAGRKAVESGRMSGLVQHIRWHTNRDVLKLECKFCIKH